MSGQPRVPCVAGLCGHRAVSPAGGTDRRTNVAGRQRVRCQRRRATSGQSPIPKAQQQLYSRPHGSHGAQPQQIPFAAQSFEGKATGEMLDLSLDDAIQRGLRRTSASSCRLRQQERQRPAAGAAAGAAADRHRRRQHQVEQVNLAAFGLKFPASSPSSDRSRWSTSAPT